MNKKKILSTGAVALVAISCFGTNTFADSKTELKNSMEVNMHVDANGNTEYEYTVINGEIRTNGSTSKKLTKGRFDLIYGIMKMDSDNIVVTVKNAPSGGKTSFEIVSEWGGTIASSGSKTYGKGSTWSAKGHYGILGVLNSPSAIICLINSLLNLLIKNTPSWH